MLYLINIFNNLYRVLYFIYEYKIININSVYKMMYTYRHLYAYMILKSQQFK